MRRRCLSGSPQPPLVPGAACGWRRRSESRRSSLPPLLLQAEELIAAKLTAQPACRRVCVRSTSTLAGVAERSGPKIRPEVGAMQQLLGKEWSTGRTCSHADEARDTNTQMTKLLEFLEWTAMHYIRALESQLTSSGDRQLRRISGRLGRMVDGISWRICKKVLMLPFSSLLEGFPKLVRGLVA